MAVQANCPSCGAPVVFQSASSVFAVCEYCRSTLVRHDRTLEDIGKMAALVEDRSPLQLGSEGHYQGVHFALIGRIQLRYRQGVWNEWHLLFDDMRTGWLSEAAGEYVLTFVQPVMEPLPPFSELSIGQRIVLASQTWTVSNLEHAECIAGQGELPFKVGAGYPVDAADLRNGAGFATLDYSESLPLLFVGEAVAFASLQLSRLRQGGVVPVPSNEARVFRCPGCGAPLQARSSEILAVACAACGMVVDTTDQNYRVLSQALGSRDERYAPRLPLGSQGRLEARSVEVIGFLVRQCKVDGIAYAWREYLLAAESGRYLWLTEYNGHWNVAEVLSTLPASSANEMADVNWGGERFRHFSTTPAAEVIQVAGEFTWRIERGERCRVVDYVAPPVLLSRETTNSDLTWTQGRYIEPALIAEAFRIPSLPAPVGVYANQPNPWTETHRKVCRRFWQLGLLAIALQIFFVVFSSSQLLLRQAFTFTPQHAEESQVTREFSVHGKPRKLMVRNTTSLDNNWIGLDLTLVNKATGAAWPAAREIAFYAGNDGGESWSEGNRSDEVVFLDIPPGTYYLVLDPELAPEKPVAVDDRVEVLSGGAGWSNFVLVMLFLAAFPIFTRLRHTAFEARRWLESDHPPVSTGTDTDDD